MEKTHSGPFQYSPIIARPKITWPHDARVALWVIPNIEAFSLSEPMQGGTGKIPDVPQYAKRDYGVRVGIWRIIDILDSYGIRATVALNSDVCDYYPQIIERTKELNWEFMGHNQTNTRRLNEIPPNEEKSVIHKTLERIETATGKRPAGWLGAGLQETWNTLNYLVEEGCRYIADWVNDDQPYLMNIVGQTLVSIPYSSDINDKPAFERYYRTPQEFENMICRQFDVLYQEGKTSGRVMAIALHPYIIGVPYRIEALNAGLRYICKHPGVWLTTGSEIVEHYLSLNF